MNTFTAMRRVAVVAAAATMAVLLGTLWKPLRIEYHRSFIRDSRAPFHDVSVRWRDYLDVRTILWISRGCPDRQNIMEDGQRHEDELVRLGYFDRRWYHFTNMNSMNPGELVSNIRTGPLQDDLRYFTFGQNGSLEVVAHRDDFPKIEQAIRQFGGQK